MSNTLRNLGRWTYRISGLRDVWHRTNYSDWLRYFGWVFGTSLLCWIGLAVLEETGGETQSIVALAGSVFGATAGSTTVIILLTEATKLLTKKSIEAIDERKRRREAARAAERRQAEEDRERGREEGREEALRKLEEIGVHLTDDQLRVIRESVAPANEPGND